MTRERHPLIIERAVDEFEAWFRVERGARPASVRSYIGTLLRLCAALPRRDPRTIERAELRIWIAREWGSAKPRTRAAVMAHVHAFFAWLAEEYDCIDPTAGMRRPKKDQPSVARLSAEDAARMIRAARRAGGRERLVVELGMGSGLRVSELAALRWYDFDLGRRPARAYVREGKGGKARIVPLGDELAELLLEQRGDPYEYVIPGAGRGRQVEPRSGERPVSVQVLQRIVRRVAIAAGVHDAERVTPHTLRHAFADQFVRLYPGRVEDLKEILGHESIATTQGYFKRVEVERFEPLMRPFTYGPHEPEIVTDPCAGPATPDAAGLGVEPRYNPHKAVDASDDNPETSQSPDSAGGDG